MNIIKIKTTKFSTDVLHSVYCVHISSIFTSCQFWPIKGITSGSLPKIQTSKKFGQFSFSDRQIDRPTDRPTDRQNKIKPRVE